MYLSALWSSLVRTPDRQADRQTDSICIGLQLGAPAGVHAPVLLAVCSLVRQSLRESCSTGRLLFNSQRALLPHDHWICGNDAGRSSVDSS